MFNHNDLLRQRKILKFILDIWTIVTFIIFILDFFTVGGFTTSATSIGIIYLVLLGIYISEKEYIRWKNSFTSRFLGESFVVVWTIITMLFVIISVISNGQYHLPEDFAVVYVSVIGAFAISQHSKALKAKKK